ncbi:MAG: site-specific DNA-methyltransferase [Thermogutta sp.]|uniref:DNA-methyltransferase n=1 Tax=Thermogutta sp. TaxID=1962930 RepID=UPI0019AF873C|nr:DNA methyltransferase [Thermogutta sp.]MBC7352837.1 site-specific DNA-methyltransferase [Thermogutta sp.]
MENDSVSDGQFNRLLHGWFGQMARMLLPGHALYIWGGYANPGNHPPVLREHMLHFSQGIVWDKEHPVLTRKDFLGCFELTFYGGKRGTVHRFFGPNNVPDLWHVKQVNPNKMIHLTEKPVELAVHAIQYSSLAGENVLDLFGGVGSTPIAAEQTGRRPILMELDPLYCDVLCSGSSSSPGGKGERIPAREAMGMIYLASPSQDNANVGWFNCLWVRGTSPRANRARAAGDFRFFCEQYFPLTFHLPWSADHLKVISKIEQAALRGGLFALAMPRGSGKTTICECACIWAVLYGHREFVCLLGSDEGHAMDMLESIKMELEGNEVLLEDFPDGVSPHPLSGRDRQSLRRTTNSTRGSGSVSNGPP